MKLSKFAKRNCTFCASSKFSLINCQKNLILFLALLNIHRSLCKRQTKPCEQFYFQKNQSKVNSKLSIIRYQSHATQMHNFTLLASTMFTQDEPLNSYLFEGIRI